MRILGAVLAGGKSRRFGSDKAVALLDGACLIDHVIARLAPQVSAMIVCGRQWPSVRSIEDRPGPNLGPLGGLCAALHHGNTHGFDAVLTVPCDAPDLPARIVDDLHTAGMPALLATLPVIGLWPCNLSARLDQHLATTEDRSLRRFARAAGARAIVRDGPLANINRPEDLARLTV